MMPAPVSLQASSDFKFESETASLTCSPPTSSGVAPSLSSPPHAGVPRLADDRVITPDKLADLFAFFVKYHHGSPHALPTVRRVQDVVNSLFAKDYHFSVIRNENGEYCKSYPMDLIILENEKTGPFKVAAGAASTKVNDAQALKPLMKASRYSRAHGRFVMPSILCRGKNISRSSTLSIYGESLLNHFTARSKDFFSWGKTIEKAEDDHDYSATPYNYELQRQSDVNLLSTLCIKHICDLMVENQKTKMGISISSSEKVEADRYSKFKLNIVPYPGCEFFRVFKDNKHQAEKLFFDWQQPAINAQLNVATDAHAFPFSWSEYKAWDLVQLSKHYLQLFLELLGDADPKAGLLVHCISGWDRTPLFISLLRLSLWADGEIHHTLNAKEILYLTLAYDWMLFSHQLSNRLSKGEDVFYFCFYLLPFLVGEQFSLTARMKQRSGSSTSSSSASVASSTQSAASSLTAQLITPLSSEPTSLPGSTDPSSSAPLAVSSNEATPSLLPSPPSPSPFAHLDAPLAVLPQHFVDTSTTDTSSTNEPSTLPPSSATIASQPLPLVPNAIATSSLASATSTHAQPQSAAASTLAVAVAAVVASPPLSIAAPQPSRARSGLTAGLQARFAATPPPSTPTSAASSSPVPSTASSAVGTPPAPYSSRLTELLRSSTPSSSAALNAINNETPLASPTSNGSAQSSTTTPPTAARVALTPQSLIAQPISLADSSRARSNPLPMRLAHIPPPQLQSSNAKPSRSQPVGIPVPARKGSAKTVSPPEVEEVRPGSWQLVDSDMSLHGKFTPSSFGSASVRLTPDGDRFLQNAAAAPLESVVEQQDRELSHSAVMAISDDGALLPDRTNKQFDDAEKTLLSDVVHLDADHLSTTKPGSHDEGCCAAGNAATGAGSCSAACDGMCSERDPSSDDLEDFRSGDIDPDMLEAPDTQDDLLPDPLTRRSTAPSVLSAEPSTAASHHHHHRRHHKHSSQPSLSDALRHRPSFSAQVLHPAGLLEDYLRTTMSPDAGPVGVPPVVQPLIAEPLLLPSAVLARDVHSPAAVEAAAILVTPLPSSNATPSTSPTLVNTSSMNANHTTSSSASSDLSSTLLSPVSSLLSEREARLKEVHKLFMQLYHRHVCPPTCDLHQVYMDSDHGDSTFLHNAATTTAASVVPPPVVSPLGFTDEKQSPQPSPTSALQQVSSSPFPLDAAASLSPVPRSSPSVSSQSSTVTASLFSWLGYRGGGGASS